MTKYATMPIHPDRVAIVILAYLVVAAFANVVFGGKSLVTSENFNPLDFRHYAAGSVPSEEWTRRNLLPFANYRDPAAAWVQADPLGEFLRRSLRRGEFPFWDPYVGGGMPSFATLIPAYVFPPSFVVAALGNSSLLRNAYILLLIFASGAMTYLLMRAHAVNAYAALAGAIAFMFSGAVVQTASGGMGQPVAFFALPLLATARLLQQPSPRRAAATAAAFAFVALASFPPMLFQIFGFCVLYVVVLVSAAHRGRTARALWFIGAAAWAILIVAAAYLPAAIVIADAPHIADSYRHAAAETLQPRQLWQLLSPTAYGGAPVYANSPFGPSGSFLYYTGVVTLFLAGVGCLARSESPTRTLKLTAIIASALVLAKIFGSPLIHWIIHVPVLRNIHYAAYFGVVVAFAFAVLAALGLDALMTGRAKRASIVTSAAVVACALILLRLYAGDAGVDFHPEGWRWIADFRLLVLFASLAVAFAALGRTAPRRATILILGVLVVEGLTNSAYPRQRRWNIWRHPPQYVELLPANGGRVLPMPIYQANAQSVFNHPTLDSHTLFTSPRIYELYQRYFAASTEQFQRNTRRIPPEGVLNASNIEFLLMQPNNATNVAEAVSRGYETFFKDEYVQVFRRRTTPRYTFTTRYAVMAAPAALRALPSSDVLLLERAASFPSAASAVSALADEPRVEPKVLEFNLNAVDIEVDTPRAGMLVCSESHMRGWSASIDDNPATLVQANYAFRAVEVPPGRHVIRLRYRAPGFRVGLLLSIAAIAACVIALRVKPPAP
jgi:hypothetical protein